MKKVVLAVLIATLMIASRPMTTEAADQSINPICTDLSVKKDLVKRMNMCQSIAHGVAHG